MAVRSLSGIQKGVTFLFPAEGGHRLSHTSNACSTISEGKGAMQEGRQHTYAAEFPARFLQFGEISNPPHLPELSSNL